MISPRRALLVVALLAFVAPGARAQVPLKNHALDIDAAGATICENGVMFAATTTDSDAVGVPMTAQVFDQLGTTLRATGGTFTFTSIGQTTTFTVTYPIGTYASGEFIGLSVSDMPPLIIGNVGTFNNTAQVADCLLPMMPATPLWALALLLTVVLAGGFLLLGRTPGLFASTGPRRTLGVLLLAAAATTGTATAQTIVIVKDTVPSPDPQDFHFTGTLGEFDLDDDSDPTLPDSTTFMSLTPGTFTVTEDPVTGYLLTALSCADPTENSTTSLSTATATIVLDGSETITCTFTNQLAGKLVVDKVTEPAGDPTVFDFSLGMVESTPFAFFSLTDEAPPFMTFLLPGEYAVSETVPAGWELLDSSCDSEESPEDGIMLAAGETTTCTFVNRTTVTSNLGFSKAFSPDPIGPGSVSTLTFTITNPDGLPADLLTFSDDLPAGMTIAGVANPTSTCGGTVVALAGGSRVEFSGGGVAGTSGGAVISSCQVSVDVTTSTPGPSTNTSNPLTSTDGIAGGPMAPTLATADLTVDTSLPGFSKSFDPPAVLLGARSRLELKIDNSLNALRVGSLDFVDNLPVGMVIADPANAVTDCVSSTVPDTTVIADPGSSVVVLDANGSSLLPGFEVLDAGMMCTVAVDIVGAGAGILGNVSNDLVTDSGTAGGANATLEVTTAPLHIRKRFIDDPVPPGGTVTLELEISNFSRTESATAVEFEDDLEAALTGLTFDSLLANDCGGTITGAGTTTIDLSGGTIGPEGSCIVRAGLTVPAVAVPGDYTNTTGAVSGLVGGEPVVGNMASDTLFVSPVPLLTKEFLEVGTLAPDPVINAGDDVVLRFTVTNTSSTSGATDVAFLDELTDGSGGSPPDTTSGFLPFPVSVTLPPTPDPPCGPGSSLDLVSRGTDRQALSLTGGSLAAAASCTFDVVVSVPDGFAPGLYLNTTEQPTATVDGATRTGKPASDSLTVIAAPSLSKDFIDDPVAPGATVTLEFTLRVSPDQIAGATAIGFTDDLAPVLAGLTATGLPLTEACDPDGPGGAPGTGTLSASAGDTFLTFMGGSLMAGESCTFSVTLQVPASAPPGTFANATSEVSATVGGVAATSAAAGASLKVSGLVFTKEFLTDPVLAGETTLLRFTINNVHPSDDAVIVFFIDNLAADLPGLAATGPSSMDTCGGSLSGTSFLIYVGGAVTSGASCVIEVEVLVPPGADDGTYTNLTSTLTATQGGGTVAADPAADTLTVQSTLLELTKEFIDDPAAPGDPVTLEFTLTNLDPTRPASMIGFSDDFAAVLPGLAENSGMALANECGGMAALPTSNFVYTGGSLAAGASCKIRLSLDVPPAADPNVYLNTTSEVTGEIGGFAVRGEAASDELTVRDLLLFTKAFDGPAKAGEIAVLTFSITNPGDVAAINLGFTDNLDSVVPGLVATGLPLTDICGLGSQIGGTSMLTFSGGQLGGMGASCTFDIDVVVPASAPVGTFENTTSPLSENGLEVAEPATADLTVEGPIDLTKAFLPSTIGPGSTSELVFTVANLESGLLAEDVAFTDVLPPGVSLATPASAFTDCTNATLSAADGGTMIALSGARLGVGSTCTVSVNVTAAAAGTYDNTSGILSSSIGGGGPAKATLTVDSGRPGFSKSFVPAVVQPGGASQLVFLIDNTANGASLTTLSFADNLPAGLVVATPSNAVTDCESTLVAADLIADPGTSLISLSALGTGDFPVLAAGGICTVAVDVTASTPGLYVNVSDTLFSVPPSDSSGFATAALDVFAGFLIKSFTDDPVPPGGTVTLEFTINNPSRDFPATDITFTDDLDSVLPGTPDLAVAGSLPTAPCGPGSTLTVAPINVLTLAGGNLPAEGSCTFSVTLSVPAGAPTGSHLNTTSAISGTIDGATEFGDPASDELRVVSFPMLTKEFLDAMTMAPDPVVGAGDDVKIRFSVTNTSTTSMATDIDFFDELTSFLPFPVTVSAPTPSPPCGAASSFALVSCGTDCQGLALSNGSLAAAPGAGSTCSFDVVLSLPTGLATGTYVNTTDEITAMVDGETLFGFAASDSFDLVAAPRLTKEFLGDPVQPGGTVTLEFTLEHDALAPGDAVDVEFTDDLAAVLPGASELTPVGLPLTNACGPGNGTLTETAGSLVFAGATLAPGEICTFSVTLNVPADAPAGTHTNKTSNVVATVLGVATTANPAEDDLTVGGLILTKTFLDDPVIAGGTVTLEFVISNLSPMAATNISFTDPLDPDVLEGLTVLSGSIEGGPSAALPLTDPCGTGSTLEVDPDTPTAEGLRLSGGSLSPVTPMEGSGTCTFSVELMVPVGTPSDSYVNRTESLTAKIGGMTLPFPNAQDELEVATGQLLLTKEFTDDPVVPGGVVTLEFTIATLGAFDEASDLAFTDDLGAALAGLEAIPPFDTGTCGGTLTGTSFLAFSGGSLTNAECSFAVDVQVPSGLPVGTTADNVTSALSGTIEGLAVTGEPAEDTLLINSFVFSKEFDGPTVPGGNPVLSFSIENLSTTEAVSDLGFTDNLDAVFPGLVASGLPPTPCGAGSTISGTSMLALAGGNLLPGGSCTFSVVLSLPAMASGGSFFNTTSNLTIFGSPVAQPATATLVIEPAPTFSKVFVPDVIAQGTNSRLTFTIDNSASSVAASALAFTDVLPFDLLVAMVPNVVNACGGTVTAPAGGTSIALSGGTVGAGSSCTLSIDVNGPTPRTAVNTSGALTSSSGNSGPATAVLGVAMCMLSDVDLVITDPPLFGALTVEACNTITLRQHFTIFGPSGALTARAGSAVIIENGVTVATDGELAIELDPALLGMVPPP